MIPHRWQWYPGWGKNQDPGILIYQSVCLTICWIVCLITHHRCFDIGWVVVSPGSCQSCKSAWQVEYWARRNSENAKRDGYFSSFIPDQNFPGSLDSLDDLHYWWLQKLVRDLRGVRQRHSFSEHPLSTWAHPFQPLTEQSRKWFMGWKSWADGISTMDFSWLTFCEDESIPTLQKWN